MIDRGAQVTEEDDAMAELPHVTTSWTLIHEAARGQPAARNDFARLYAPAIHAFLRRALFRLRWAVRGFAHELDNVSQDVFLEFFKPRGALERIDRRRCTRFRDFLFGVVSNITRRSQTRWFRDQQVHLADGAELEHWAGRESATPQHGERVQADP